MSFNSLGLSKALLKAIDKKGYEQPSPIQEKSIPIILKGRDVLASAQTGTGKTAGFTLPVLHLLSKNERSQNRPIRALILTPTRELAAQVYENIREYSVFTDIRSTVIFGGVSQKPQVTKLKKGVDILVATPGRLIDLKNQNQLSLAKVEILILDEADRMLDMGFLRDINRIMKLLPVRRQNLLFSATFSKDIKALATSILNKPIQIEVATENSTVDVIAQKAYFLPKDQKARFLITLIAEENWSQVLVFTRTKHGANRLAKKMTNNNITAAAIHGDKSQGARTRALADFKNGLIRVLVATDIAARGLDIPLLPHVVNYELPNISEDYVHRIGRTGRAGASGEAMSLVQPDERQYLKDIEKLIGMKIFSETPEGFESEEPVVKKPQNRRNNSNSNNKNKNRNRNRNKKSRANNSRNNKK